MAQIGKVNDAKHVRGEVLFANDLEARGMIAVSFMERVALHFASSKPNSKKP
jgi:hypothetical protein